jgi:hypothetical protein
MKKILLLAAILIALPDFAQTTPTPDPRIEIDEFFNNSHHLRSSGCDSSTWAAIHQALLSDLNVQKLPEAAPDADDAQADRIMECRQIIVRRLNGVGLDLAKNIEKDEGQIAVMANYFPDAEARAKAALLLALQVNEDIETNSRLLDDYKTLNLILGFAREATDSYTEHAQNTRYRNLAARYNALVGQYNARVNQPNNLRPVSLHCESSTTPWGVTTTDCR